MTSVQRPIGSRFGAASTATEVLEGVDLTDRTAVVTGGYSGIGLETTRVLAGAGARVVVPARRPDVATDALAGIGGVEVDELDLGDLKSVATFAQRFLAWPLPYTMLLSGWLQAVTDATVHGLRQVVAVLAVAQPLDGSDGSLFAITHGGNAFVVSVGSACAGVNGSLGFLLVGTAVLAAARGGITRKAFWLINGLILTLVLNVVRIVMIFGAGHLWGQDFAIEALHPVIGLVTFNMGVLAAVLALPLFGITLSSAPAPPVREAPPKGGAASPLPARRRLPVQRD
jgi:exosortase/archaeosortase family protein